MKRSALLIACLAFLGLLLAAGACEQPRAGSVGPRGHEGTETVSEQASRGTETAPAPASAVDGEVGDACRSIEARAGSLKKAAPDAEIYLHLTGSAAQEYVARFNRDHRTLQRADEVALVFSAKYWGDRAIVLFARDRCEAGMMEIRFGGLS